MHSGMFFNLRAPHTTIMQRIMCLWQTFHTHNCSIACMLKSWMALMCIWGIQRTHNHACSKWGVISENIWKNIETLYEAAECHNTIYYSSWRQSANNNALKLTHQISFCWHAPQIVSGALGSWMLVCFSNQCIWPLSIGDITHHINWKIHQTNPMGFGGCTVEPDKSPGLQSFIFHESRTLITTSEICNRSL